jgi:hypothetical protein
MYKSTPSYIEERWIKGIKNKKEKLHLIFKLWQDKKVDCYLDLYEPDNVAYLYKSIIIKKDTDIEGIEECITIVDYLISDMEEDEIIKLEEYIEDGKLKRDFVKFVKEHPSHIYEYTKRFVDIEMF